MAGLGNVAVWVSYVNRRVGAVGRAGRATKNPTRADHQSAFDRVPPTGMLPRDGFQRSPWQVTPGLLQLASDFFGQINCYIHSVQL